MLAKNQKIGYPLDMNEGGPNTSKELLELTEEVSFFESEVDLPSWGIDEKRSYIYAFRDDGNDLIAKIQAATIEQSQKDALLKIVHDRISEVDQEFYRD